MSYGRSGVMDGQQVVLRSIFVDADGNMVSASTLPSVYIYDESVDSDVIQADIDADTYTNAFAGPFTPTLISTGFYQYTYTVPVDSVAGVWHDVWIGDINSTVSSAILSFTVNNGVDISEQKLNNNELIIIELDETIADVNGLTLANDIQLSFITTLSPFYASVDMVRMEIGPWIDFIPDNTLAIMIHWSSKEADFIKGASAKNSQRLSFARSKFVIYDAVLKTLYLPGASSYQPGGIGATKRLADLQIGNNSNTMATTSSGIDKETLGYFRKNRQEWQRIVNAAGNIMPGQSLSGLTGALRGLYDPDRRLQGRQWADPNEVYFQQPGVNAKVRMPGQRKGKMVFLLNNTFAGNTSERINNDQP